MRLLLVLVVLAVPLAACGPSAKERSQLQYFKRPYQNATSTDRYVVAPPDVLSISAPNVPEIKTVKQQIAPDGTLNLDLLKRVYIAGLTPLQVEELLTEKLRTFYKDAKVRVEVEYHSQWYYVFGETANSGPKRFTGRDTLVTALADAQPTRLAWPERIYVVRPSPDPNTRHVTVVNLKEIIQLGDATSNVLLEQDDIVYVPLNPLAAIGVSVQNLLFPAQPVFQAAGGVGMMRYGF